MLHYAPDAYDRWIDAYPELEEQIRLIQLLHTAQRALDVRPDDVACTLEPEDVTHALDSGASLAIVDSLPVEDERWREAFLHLVGHVVDHFPTEEGAHLMIQLHNGKIDVPTLMLDVLDQNLEHVQAVANDLEIDPETLGFLTAATLTPFLSAYAVSIDKQLLQEHWLHGYCPICGREPLFSVPGGDSRDLFCNQCQTQWRYPPRQCAFCGSSDHHAYVEEPETGIEVEACRKCHRYLRQVSQEQLNEMDPALLDLLTAKAGESLEEAGFH